MLRAARGDQRAWDALIREFSGMIWAVARAHRLPDASAADVAQATWLALLQHLTRLKDPTRVGAWLATTARRECLRVIRDSERSVPFGDEAPEHEAKDTSRREMSCSSGSETARCGRASRVFARQTRRCCAC